MITNRSHPESSFDGTNHQSGDAGSDWLVSALEEIGDSDLLNYSRSVNSNGEILSGRLEEKGLLPKVAAEFATLHHADLDLDGNGYISEKEMGHVLDSQELSRNLSAVERNTVAFLKDNWKVAANGSNDQWFSEDKGISLKDAENLSRIDKRKFAYESQNSFSKVTLRTGNFSKVRFSANDATGYGAANTFAVDGPNKLAVDGSNKLDFSVSNNLELPGRRIDYTRAARLQLDADIAAATLGAIPRSIRASIGTAFNAGAIERVSTALGFGTTLDAIGAKYKSMADVPESFIGKSIENGASSPLEVSEFLSKRFADFDLDGNHFLSNKELDKIKTSKLWSRSLSEFDTKVIDEAKRYGRRINEANDDEFLWEKKGMSKNDLIAFGLTHVKNVDEMPKEPGDYLKMAQVGDDPRQYLIHIPPSYDGTKKVPLMIFLHPFMGSAEAAAELTAFNKKADEEGFIAIYPNGRFCEASGTRAWNITDFPDFMSSDTDFVATIMETAKEGLEIDPSKVFVAGYSNGGMLAQDIATKFSDKVAAVACVSGCMTGLEEKPSQDVSVLMIHGGKDRVVPYEGRLKWLNEIGFPAMRSVDYARDFWTDKGNLSLSEKQTVEDGVHFERWTNSERKTELQIYTLDDMKHRYPGGNYEPSNTVPDAIKATDVIWDFFETQSKTIAKPTQPLRRPEIRPRPLAPELLTV